MDNHDGEETHVEDTEEVEEEVETQTQSTQAASQSQSQPSQTLDAHLWGYLQPCTSSLARIDFWKIHPRYTVGRNTETNQVVLPGFKVSNTHCLIRWDGYDTVNSAVWVEDKSSNGTFINGEKIGRGKSRVLREGNEIAFGTCIPQTHNKGLEDYRFIYRHTAGGVPTEGLFAQYDLGTELGKGSFATVRKGIKKDSGKWYAIKMIHPSKTVGQQGSPRNNTLSREISIMEQLDHPNVCRLHETFFQPDDSINLVLELIDGGDLLEHILKHNGLNEVDTRDITYQICDAMSYIHSKGVTHRDLKPENILLTKKRPPVIKVADFGLAKVVDHLTMLRTMCGTPSYLAPEVVCQTNQQGYDNRVDSWSVGVIVFAMLSNSSPFLENSALEIKERIIQRTIDWRTLQERYPSEEAIDFIRRLLQTKAEERMQLCDAVHHRWLTAHVPFYTREELLAAQSHSMDEEMESGRESTVEEMPSNSQGSQRLQRRSIVVAQAAEGGQPLPEPSWEMVAKARGGGGEEGTNGKKRQLSGIDEEEDLGGEEAESEEEGGSRPRRSSRRTKIARRG